MNKLEVMICSPLEAELVERIRQVDPEQISVSYESDLYPPLRYTCDHKGVQTFKRSEEQMVRWRSNLEKAEVLLDCPIPKEMPGDLVHLKSARWIQFTSSGIGEFVKRSGLDRSDLLLTTARGVHSGPLAEWTFMALLMYFKKFRFLETEQKLHRWERYCDDEVAGRTLLTIGAGDLARGVAVVARALGMRVVAVTRSPDKPRAHAGVFDEIHGVADLHQLLPQADAIVCTVPHTDETENMLDRKAISLMRPGVAFVNTGRGSTIDEVAMIEALRNGKIGFAAIDVAQIEPLPSSSPLWDMPNVMINPHSASTVSTENAKIVDIFCHNLKLYLRGEQSAMSNIFDKQLLY